MDLMGVSTRRIGERGIARRDFDLSSLSPAEPDSYGPKGQEDLAQGLPWVGPKDVFSPEGAPGRECLSHDWKARLCLNRNFPDRSRSRRRSRARFLKASIEWFVLFLGIKSRTRTIWETGLATWYSPFRANPFRNLAQGKPWARFSWPFGPQRS
jgi:hypothetical protein